MKLSNDAKAVLLRIYALYLEDIDRGEEDYFARIIPGVSALRRYFPDWSDSRINSACYALEDVGLLQNVPGDNLCQFCTITDEGIDLAENGDKYQALDILSVLERIVNLFKFGS